MDQVEVLLTLEYSSATNDYGFHIDDSRKPSTVINVRPFSPAAKAGLQSGDLLLLVNGHDVTAMETARILSIISYSQCAPITMKISRKHTSSNTMKESMDVDFKKTIEGAVQTAMDAVTLLSDDFNFNYGESEIMDDDEISDARYSESSQAEILSDLMRAQHGMQDILKNVKQQHPMTEDGKKDHPQQQQREVFLSEGSIVPSVTHNRGPSPLPPPVPPYNPGSPDFFLLSNKPEYKTEIKKQRHYYEDIELSDPLPTQLQQQTQQPCITTSSSSNSKELKDKGSKLLQLVNKHTVPPHPSIELLKTCKGIPASVHAWKKEHVLVWLQKLDLALFIRCKDVLERHDVTGHTLLHLNELKLENMGIRNTDDRIQLGTFVAKLRLTHELSELKELSDQVSWL